MMKNITLLRGESVGSNSSAVEHRISFKKVQLLHEIADYGYLEGEMIDEALVSPKRETQDVVQGNNAARIVRILDLAYTRVLRQLSPLTDGMASGSDVSDDVPDGREDYVVVLSVGEAWPAVRVEHLRNVVHDYMLAAAIFQWLSITNPSAAAKWGVSSSALLEEIKDMRFMGGMYHRPYSPF